MSSSEGLWEGRKGGTCDLWATDPDADRLEVSDTRTSFDDSDKDEPQKPMMKKMRSSREYFEVMVRPT